MFATKAKLGRRTFLSLTCPIVEDLVRRLDGVSVTSLYLIADDPEFAMMIVGGYQRRFICNVNHTNRKQYALERGGRDHSDVEIAQGEELYLRSMCIGLTTVVQAARVYARTGKLARCRGAKWKPT